MFLITTADERYWKLDGPVLLLGEWCRTFSNRHVWERIRHDVLPYHWDDREKLHRDYIYLDGVYERTLARVATGLNGALNVDHTLRYWRIILGPWLSMFTSVLFDRYESLLAAARSGKVTETWIGEYEGTAWLPRDIRPFLRWVGDSDAYNQFLFSWLIRDLGVLPATMRREERMGQNPPVALRRRPTLRVAAVRAAARAARYIPAALKRVVLVTSSLSLADHVRLELKLRQVPTWELPDVPAHPARVDAALRARAFRLESGDAFEAVLARALAAQCPPAYLEHYHVMRESALGAYPARPAVIFTANSYEANEGFKLWAAEQVERGAKLVGTQHGCHYGTARIVDTEDHQVRIYDRFFSWGWTAPEAPHIVPLAAAKFNRALRTVRPRPDGRVMLATFVWPRYAYRLFSVPIAAGSVRAHLDEQFRFAVALPPEIRQALVVRLFPNDRGWHQREQWAEHVPGVECYAGPKKFLTHLTECRLLVTTCTSTPHLEAFAADFPTLLFWNPRQFELRPAAQPFYDMLAKAGILHETPEEAARALRAGFDDPLTWWRHPDRQRARRVFCDQFVRTSSAWAEEWKRELLDLAAQARGRMVTTGAEESRS